MKVWEYPVNILNSLLTVSREYPNLKADSCQKPENFESVQMMHSQSLGAELQKRPVAPFVPR